MGGYLLFNIEFPNKETRDKFEKQEKLKRMFQYWERIGDGGKGKEDYYDCTYYPTWEGYAEPREILKRCRKNKIKLKRFLSIDLSTQGSWFDEIKQKDYKEEE